MHSVALADTLTVEPADELTLEVGRGGRVPADGANLALRAANALREATGVQKGARLWLGKRIPVAAGMGGGSADAAAVLVGLNRLWGCGLSQAELEQHRPHDRRGRPLLRARRPAARPRHRRAAYAAVHARARFGWSSCSPAAGFPRAMCSDGWICAPAWTADRRARSGAACAGGGRSACAVRLAGQRPAAGGAVAAPGNRAGHRGPARP